MITTTLNDIRKHSPCTSGWEKLLTSLDKTAPDDMPLPLEHILDSNGLDDALWALQAIEGHDRAFRLFACHCAKVVLPLFEKEYPEDKRVRKAIETAERFAAGEASLEELDAARDAAWDAAWDAARDAAGAAARDAQAQEFRRMCRREGEYGI